METAGGTLGNLAPLAPLIDREQEQVLVTRLIREQGVRLLTLTGPGGVGKTRLALALAEQLAPDAADGAYVVPLASVSDPALVPMAIAQTLGVLPQADEPVEALLQFYLGDRQVLLMLDNVEHVVDAAGLVAALLATCPSLVVLATSRAPLQIQGEQVVPITPLLVPGVDLSPESLHDNPAVTLFVERTRAALPGYALDTPAAATVAEIVRRLDGLPLAIELAAARMRVLSADALLSRLEPRLPLLSGDRAGLPERHRTLRATVAWSYDLLGAAAQALFRRLAIFAGPFTLEGAEMLGMIGGVDVIDALSELVDQGLVGRTPQIDDDRFSMLQTVREYGLELLAASGEEEAVRAAHAAHFLALAERAEPELTGAEQTRWTILLADEHANLRLALGFFIDRGRAEESLRMGSALWPFWARRGHLREGRDWLERALALPSPASPAVRARATRRLGNLALDLADLARAETMYEASLRAARELGDEMEIARTLTSLGLIALHRADLERARALFNDARRRWDTEGTDEDRARILHNLGRTALMAGDTREARALFDQAVTLRQALGDREGLAYTTVLIAETALADGQAEVAEQLLHEAGAQFREQGSVVAIAWMLHDLGRVEASRGDLVAADAQFRESLAINLEQMDRLGAADDLEALAGIAIHAGHPDRGARWLAAAARWRETSGMGRGVFEQRAVDALFTLATRQLGEDGMAAALAAGRLLKVEQAAEAALGEPILAAQAPVPVDPRVEAYGLTSREREVLAEIASGYSDREIADHLFISRRTVGAHVSSILAKMDVTSRAAAVARAIREGIV
ncbi:MAG TPA: tetratricopeptide repeat protein [Thermomicrobiales bacterium]|nr:tetratricopeptide repeat protein [Thermomicrobiales bacterium]